ncbi:hypothetical protein MRX96_007519 [Rhipicephalus microplus]
MSELFPRGSHRQPLRPPWGFSEGGPAPPVALTDTLLPRRGTVVPDSCLLYAAISNESRHRDSEGSARNRTPLGKLTAAQNAWPAIEETERRKPLGHDEQRQLFPSFFRTKARRRRVNHKGVRVPKKDKSCSTLGAPNEKERGRQACAGSLKASLGRFLVRAKENVTVSTNGTEPAFQLFSVLTSPLSFNVIGIP